MDVGTAERAASENRSERGVTLVEILVAVTLLGVVGVTLVSAFFGIVRASATQRDVADAETGTWQFAEWMSTWDSLGLELPCPFNRAVLWVLYSNLNPETTDKGATVSVDAERIWDGDPATLQDPSTWPEVSEPGACGANGNPLHYFEFTITARDGTKRSGSVVLRENRP